jgi:hypothetical protein
MFVRIARASAASAPGLSPGGLSAPRHPRPVSYYALFQGWLLLSQPPGCRRAATALPTEPGLGGLSRRSGLFPSRRRVLAPAVSLPGGPPAAFGVWFGSVSGKPPRRSSALPPRGASPEAAPKCISGRTSYLRVRLAFHPYPQVIRAFCNRRRSGPPRACSARFGLPRGSSPGFGSAPRDSAPAERGPSPLRTRLRSGSACDPGLASPRGATRRLILQKARRHQDDTWLRPAGGARFQALFHSPRRGAFHRSLTVLVRSRSPRVFSLGRWSAPLPARCRVSGGTHAAAPPRTRRRRLRDSHPLRSPVPAAFG